MFLIAFILLFNLPQTIAEPINQLTFSIRQIADKNYNERVHFKGSEEFNSLAESFNTWRRNFRNMKAVHFPNS
jgi:methyl-accepting chemotaxis protein